MNHIRQHRPGFVSGFENEDADFNAVADLVRLPFVENFTTLPNFYRFSVASRDYAPTLLMAEYKDGYEWWVVGYLNALAGGLPSWEPRRKIEASA